MSITNLEPRALLSMTAREGRALENPETRLSLIGFSKKTCTINVYLIGPFKFARERVNMRCVWRVSGLANFGFAGAEFPRAYMRSQKRKHSDREWSKTSNSRENLETKIQCACFKYTFDGVQEKHSRSRKSICLSRKGKILQILSVIWGAK